MPTPPKIGYRIRSIGIVEVFIKGKTKDTTQTNRHIGITREVKVDLESERQQTQPSADHGQRPTSLHGKTFFPKCTNGVGQQNFLCQTHTESPCAQCKVFRSMHTAIQFFRYSLILHNRTGNQLWEHRHKGTKIDDVFLHRRIFTININGITHRLERKERNADGQRDTTQRNSHTQHINAVWQIHSCQQEQIFCKKISVLKESQQQQIKNY